MTDLADHLLRDGLDVDVLGVGSARPVRSNLLIEVRARDSLRERRR
jgi:hypothetical protein